MRTMHRWACLAALVTMMSGCVNYSDDEGGRTRRSMDQEFERSTGGELGGGPGLCTDATDPQCSPSAERIRCGRGYSNCPEHTQCITDPEYGCDPSAADCPGVCAHVPEEEGPGTVDTGHI